MLAGPIFSRETLTSPRQLKHFLIRSGYVAALLVLMFTAGQATFGYQQVRNVGDIARFGSWIFLIFSVVQLSLVLFFALLFAAGTVAQEKDRQTLILLLMTDLRDRELVLGKLFSSLLLVAVLLGASIPVFFFVHFLGGVDIGQIGWSLAITAATALAAGSWGSLVAFWREKTFQTLAISVLGLVLFLGIVEAAVWVVKIESSAGQAIALLNPFRALFSVLQPFARDSGTFVSPLRSVIVMATLAVLLNAVTVWRLRIWNPNRFVFTAPTFESEDAEGRARTQHRKIWSNPIIWREIKTRAYGRKILVIKLVYLLIAGFAIWSLMETGSAAERILGMISPSGFVFVGLSLLTLMLVNAQSVTALTAERDGKTLELLLVTDVTAKEFIFGKLGGILYNTKELLVVPLLLAGYNFSSGGLTAEHLVYVIFGYLVLVLFAAMLGLHSGLSYDNSRSSIANSLGTMFFLFIGIFIFMMLLVQARSSYALQFQSFLLFIGVGGIALLASLTHANPSRALTLAALLLPFLTFFALTEFLLGGSLGVCMAISAAYGFTTLAMLIPAVSEFDVALGRTTLDQG